MNRMEDRYKIKLLTSYKGLFDDEMRREELNTDDKFEMHNLLEGEIENVVERMIFDNTYEIFPN